MSKQVKDGGSAFPVIQTTIEVDGQCDDYTSVPNVHSVGGMTLRDYFAAKAMQGLLDGDGLSIGPYVGNNNAHVATCAYAMADSMLAAREAKS